MLTCLKEINIYLSLSSLSRYLTRKLHMLCRLHDLSQYSHLVGIKRKKELVGNGEAQLVLTRRPHQFAIINIFAEDTARKRAAGESTPYVDKLIEDVIEAE